MNKDYNKSREEPSLREWIKMPFVIIWLLLNAVILLFNYGAHKKVTPKKDESDKAEKPSESDENDFDH